MSTDNVPQNTRAVKPDTTPEERAARVEAFKHMTQDDYDHLLRIVRLLVPGNLYDPTEALSEALLTATERYDGSTKLSTFIGKFARYHALSRHRHEIRHHSFADLITAEQPDGDTGDDYLDQIIGGTTDPDYTEPVDDHFIERIKQILAKTHDAHIFYARPNIIPIADKILAVLQANANSGQGIGIDEWDTAAPCKPRKYQTHVSTNTRQPLGPIRKNLAETLGVQTFKVDYAIKALRISTATALNEGWLDYHSNPIP